MNKIKQVIGLSALIATGSAQAALVEFGQNIFLNLGTDSLNDPASDLDSRTGDFTEIGWGGTANSLYDRTGGASNTALDAGDTVWDVSEGQMTTLTNQFPGTNTPASALNNAQKEGFENGWNLSYDYTLTGTTLAVDNTNPSAPVPTAAFFSSGIMNVYFNSLDGTNGADLAGFDGLKVLQLNVSSFTADFGSQIGVKINGVVDYSFVAALSLPQQAFVQDFFNFSIGNVAFYDLWLAGQPAVLPIQWRIDTNLTDNASPTAAFAQTLRTSSVSSEVSGVPTALYAGTASTWQPVANGDLLGRSTAISPSLRFQVPEPTSLALLGIGLLGFAAKRRKSV